MPIKRCFALKVPYYMGGRLWNPKMSFATKDTVYVFVETEDGEHGVGEVWPAYGSADTIAFIVNNDVSPLIEGRDPDDIDDIRNTLDRLSPLGGIANLMLNAISGLDIALWDLRGKRRGEALGQLLGSCTKSVYAYASGGLYGKDKGLDELARETKGYVEQGFTGVKMKIGGMEMSEDVERVAAVREAIGHETRLMVDAVHAYTVPQALEVAERIRPYGIYWFESPVALEDQEGHGIINTRSGIPVCANESLSGVHQFKHLLSHRGADFVHFDLSTCGGITEARKIANLAQAEGLNCTLHAATGIHLYAASVHFASSIPNLDSVEYHFTHRWLSEHQPETLDHDGPYVAPLNQPGVGLPFINREFIEEIAEAELAKAAPRHPAQPKA